MKLHSINTEQRLYVIHCGQGLSCYGFDVLDRKARAVALWAGIPAHWPPIGTVDHFTVCADVMDSGAAYAQQTGRRCNADLTPQLIGLEGRRVEVTYPDGQRSRFYVSRSTGWMPCHLELKTARSMEGAAARLPEGSTVRVIQQRRS